MKIPPFMFGPFANEYPDAFLAIIVGFVVLFLLVFPRIRGAAQTMLADRSKRIESNQLQVNQALEDVRRLRDDYAARLKAIEAEALQRIDEAVREAEAARTEIIAEAETGAQQIRRRSLDEVARERTRRRILLRRQIVQTVLSATEDALKVQTSDTVQRQLISDFIARAGTEGISVAASVPSTSAAPAAPFTAPGGVA